MSSKGEMSPQSSQEMGRVGPAFDGRGSLKILELTFVPKIVEDFLAMDVKSVKNSYCAFMVFNRQGH
jgi:hypothetical protein